jgi:hypothetical protein
MQGTKIKKDKKKLLWCFLFIAKESPFLQYNIISSHKFVEITVFLATLWF